MNEIKRAFNMRWVICAESVCQTKTDRLEMPSGQIPDIKAAPPEWLQVRLDSSMMFWSHGSER
jgi:hypothetical protein